MAQTYRHTHDPDVFLRSDGAGIPRAPGNRDWDELDALMAEGYEPEPAPPFVVFAGEASVTASVRTTDATPTEILRVTLNQKVGYSAGLSLIGVDAGNGAVRVIRASIAAKRLMGNAIMVGAPVVLASHADGGTTAWAIAAAVSGNDVVFTVTGAAGRDVDWQLFGQAVRFGPEGVVVS